MSASDDDKILGSLRRNGPGRAQDIRAEYKDMSIARIEAGLVVLQLSGMARPTLRVVKGSKHTYWEATPI